MKKLTYYKRVDWLNSAMPISLPQLVDYINDNNQWLYVYDNEGDCTYYHLGDVSQHIQSLTSKPDIDEQKVKYLPAVNFNGYSDVDGFHYSDLIGIDFDNIQNEADLILLKQDLIKIPFIVTIFKTPSGKGLKAIVWHDNENEGLHENLFFKLKDEIKTPYAKFDDKCRDLARRHFICYDPDIWVNPNPTLYHYVYDPIFNQKPAFSNTGENNKSFPSKKRIGLPQNKIFLPNFKYCGISDNSILNMLKSECKRFHSEYLECGHRRYGCYWFGLCAGRAGVDLQKGLEFVIGIYSDPEVKFSQGDIFTDEEAEKAYLDGYDTGDFDEEYRSKFKINQKNNSLGYGY